MLEAKRFRQLFHRSLRSACGSGRDDMVGCRLARNDRLGAASTPHLFLNDAGCPRLRDATDVAPTLTLSAVADPDCRRCL